MRAVISWWDLTDSPQTIESLRDYLAGGGIEPWTSVEGLCLKFWMADADRNRWGAVMVWESDRTPERLPAHIARDLIGYPATERLSFDIEATVEGIHSLTTLAGLRPATSWRQP